MTCDFLIWPPTKLWIEVVRRGRNGKERKEKEEQEMAEEKGKKEEEEEDQEIKKKKDKKYSASIQFNPRQFKFQIKAFQHLLFCAT